MNERIAIESESQKFARRLGRMYALTEKMYYRWISPTQKTWVKALSTLEKQCETLGFLTYDSDPDLDGYVISPDCKDAYEAGYLSVYQRDSDTEFDWGWD